MEWIGSVCLCPTFLAGYFGVAGCGFVEMEVSWAEGLCFIASYDGLVREGYLRKKFCVFLCCALFFLN